MSDVRPCLGVLGARGTSGATAWTASSVAAAGFKALSTVFGTLLIWAARLVPTVAAVTTGGGGGCSGSREGRLSDSCCNSPSTGFRNPSLMLFNTPLTSAENGNGGSGGSGGRKKFHSSMPSWMKASTVHHTPSATFCAKLPLPLSQSSV